MALQNVKSAIEKFFGGASSSPYAWSAPIYGYTTPSKGGTAAAGKQAQASSSVPSAARPAGAPSFSGQPATPSPVPSPVPAFKYTKPEPRKRTLAEARPAGIGHYDPAGTKAMEEHFTTRAYRERAKSELLLDKEGALLPEPDLLGDLDQWEDAYKEAHKEDLIGTRSGFMEEHPLPQAMVGELPIPHSPAAEVFATKDEQAAAEAYSTARNLSWTEIKNEYAGNLDEHALNRAAMKSTYANALRHMLNGGLAGEARARKVLAALIDDDTRAETEALLDKYVKANMLADFDAYRTREDMDYTVERDVSLKYPVDYDWRTMLENPAFMADAPPIFSTLGSSQDLFDAYARLSLEWSWAVWPEQNPEYMHWPRLLPSYDPNATLLYQYLSGNPNYDPRLSDGYDAKVAAELEDGQRESDEKAGATFKYGGFVSMMRDPNVPDDEKFLLYAGKFNVPFDTDDDRRAALSGFLRVKELLGDPVKEQAWRVHDADSKGNFALMTGAQLKRAVAEGANAALYMTQSTKNRLGETPDDLMRLNNFQHYSVYWKKPTAEEQAYRDQLAYEEEYGIQLTFGADPDAERHAGSLPAALLALLNTGSLEALSEFVGRSYDPLKKGDWLMFGKNQLFAAMNSFEFMTPFIPMLGAKYDAGRGFMERDGFDPLTDVQELADYLNSDEGRSDTDILKHERWERFLGVDDPSGIPIPPTYESGNLVADIATYIVTDPTVWASLGTAAAAKTGATALAKGLAGAARALESGGMGMRVAGASGERVSRELATSILARAARYKPALLVPGTKEFQEFLSFVRAELIDVLPKAARVNTSLTDAVAAAAATAARGHRLAKLATTAAGLQRVANIANAVDLGFLAAAFPTPALTIGAVALAKNARRIGVARFAIGTRRVLRAAFDKATRRTRGILGKDAIASGTVNGESGAALVRAQQDVAYARQEILGKVVERGSMTPEEVDSLLGRLYVERGVRDGNLKEGALDAARVVKARVEARMHKMSAGRRLREDNVKKLVEAGAAESDIKVYEYLAGQAYAASEEMALAAAKGMRRTIGLLRRVLEDMFHKTSSPSVFQRLVSDLLESVDNPKGYTFQQWFADQLKLAEQLHGYAPDILTELQELYALYSHSLAEVELRMKAAVQSRVVELLGKEALTEGEEQVLKALQDGLAGKFPEKAVPDGPRGDIRRLFPSPTETAAANEKAAKDMLAAFTREEREAYEAGIERVAELTRKINDEWLTKDVESRAIVGDAYLADKSDIGSAYDKETMAGLRQERENDSATGAALEEQSSDVFGEHATKAVKARLAKMGIAPDAEGFYDVKGLLVNPDNGAMKWGPRGDTGGFNNILDHAGLEWNTDIEMLVPARMERLVPGDYYEAVGKGRKEADAVLSNQRIFQLHAERSRRNYESLFLNPFTRGDEPVLQDILLGKNGFGPIFDIAHASPGPDSADMIRMLVGNMALPDAVVEELRLSVVEFYAHMSVIRHKQGLYRALGEMPGLSDTDRAALLSALQDLSRWGSASFADNAYGLALELVDRAQGTVAMRLRDRTFALDSYRDYLNPTSAKHTRSAVDIDPKRAEAFREHFGAWSEKQGLSEAERASLFQQGHYGDKDVMFSACVYAFEEPEAYAALTEKTAWFLDLETGGLLGEYRGVSEFAMYNSVTGEHVRVINPPRADTTRLPEPSALRGRGLAVDEWRDYYNSLAPDGHTLVAADDMAFYTQVEDLLSKASPEALHWHNGFGFDLPMVLEEAERVGHPTVKQWFRPNYKNAVNRGRTQVVDTLDVYRRKAFKEAGVDTGIDNGILGSVMEALSSHGSALRAIEAATPSPFFRVESAVNANLFDVFSSFEDMHMRLSDAAPSAHPGKQGLVSHDPVFEQASRNQAAALRDALSGKGAYENVSAIAAIDVTEPGALDHVRLLAGDMSLSDDAAMAVWDASDNFLGTADDFGRGLSSDNHMTQALNKLQTAFDPAYRKGRPLTAEEISGRLTGKPVGPEAPAAALGDDVIPEELSLRLGSDADSLPVDVTSMQYSGSGSSPFGHLLDGLAADVSDARYAMSDVAFITRDAGGVPPGLRSELPAIYKTMDEQAEVAHAVAEVMPFYALRQIGETAENLEDWFGIRAFLDNPQEARALGQKKLPGEGIDKTGKSGKLAGTEKGAQDGRPTKGTDRGLGRETPEPARVQDGPLRADNDGLAQRGRPRRVSKAEQERAADFKSQGLKEREGVTPYDMANDPEGILPTTAPLLDGASVAYYTYPHMPGDRSTYAFVNRVPGKPGQYTVYISTGGTSASMAQLAAHEASHIFFDTRPELLGKLVSFYENDPAVREALRKFFRLHSIDASEEAIEHALRNRYGRGLITESIHDEVANIILHDRIHAPVADGQPRMAIFDDLSFPPPVRDRLQAQVKGALAAAPESTLPLSASPNVGAKRLPMSVLEDLVADADARQKLVIRATELYTRLNKTYGRLLAKRSIDENELVRIILMDRDGNPFVTERLLYAPLAKDELALMSPTDRFLRSTLAPPENAFRAAAANAVFRRRLMHRSDDTANLTLFELNRQDMNSVEKGYLPHGSVRHTPVDYRVSGTTFKRDPAPRASTKVDLLNERVAGLDTSGVREEFERYNNYIKSSVGGGRRLTEAERDARFAAASARELIASVDTLYAELKSLFSGAIELDEGLLMSYRSVLSNIDLMQPRLKNAVDALHTEQNMQEATLLARDAAAKDARLAALEEHLARDAGLEEDDLVRSYIDACAADTGQNPDKLHRLLEQQAADGDDTAGAYFVQGRPRRVKDATLPEKLRTFNDGITELLLAMGGDIPAALKQKLLNFERVAQDTYGEQWGLAFVNRSVADVFDTIERKLAAAPPESAAAFRAEDEMAVRVHDHAVGIVAASRAADPETLVGKLLFECPFYRLDPAHADVAARIKGNMAAYHEAGLVVETHKDGAVWISLRSDLKRVIDRRWDPAEKRWVRQARYNGTWYGEAARTELDYDAVPLYSDPDIDASVKSALRRSSRLTEGRTAGTAMRTLTQKRLSGYLDAAPPRVKEALGDAGDPASIAYHTANSDVGLKPDTVAPDWDAFNDRMSTFENEKGEFVVYTESLTGILRTEARNTNRLVSNKMKFVDMLTSPDYQYTLKNLMDNAGLSYSDVAKQFRAEKHNPFVCVAVVPTNSRTGYKTIVFDLRYGADARSAREMDAVLVPYTLYSKYYDDINDVRLPSFLSPLIALNLTTKASFLLSPGTLGRNVIDSSLKAVLDNGPGAASHWMRANNINRRLRQFHERVADLSKNSSNGVWSRRVVEELFASGVAQKEYGLTRDAYWTYMAFNKGAGSFGQAAAYKTLQAQLRKGPLQDLMSDGTWTSVSKLKEAYIEAGVKYGVINEALLTPMGAIEYQAKMSHFLSLMEDPMMSHSEALMRLARTHFDYNVATKFDRAMELVMPFWVFRKNNFLYWIDKFVNEPSMTRALTQTYNHLEDSTVFGEYEDAHNKSWWYSALMGNLLLGDSGLQLKLNPSYMDVFRILTMGPQEVFQSMGGPVGSVVEGLVNAYIQSNPHIENREMLIGTSAWGLFEQGDTNTPLAALYGENPEFWDFLSHEMKEAALRNIPFASYIQGYAGTAQAMTERLGWGPFGALHGGALGAVKKYDKPMPYIGYGPSPERTDREQSYKQELFKMLYGDADFDAQAQGYYYSGNPKFRYYPRNPKAGFQNPRRGMYGARAGYSLSGKPMSWPVWPSHSSYGYRPSNKYLYSGRRLSRHAYKPVYRYAYKSADRGYKAARRGKRGRGLIK